METILMNGGRKMPYIEHNGCHDDYKTKKRTGQRWQTIVIAKKISGWAACIFFILVLGKAGVSDCGASWENFFPSILYYLIGFGVSVSVWEALEKRKEKK